MYEDPLYWLYLSIAGLLTGIITAMGGSGGLIITPFLITASMPIHMAIGSAKFSSLGMWVAALLKFRKVEKIQWSLILPLSALSLSGAIIGSSITLNLDKETIYPIVGAFLVIIAPIGLIRKNFGIENISYGRRRRSIGFFLYFCAMLFGGFFGGGAHILAILTLISCFGLSAFQAHATQIIPWMLLTIVSSGIFAWNGFVDYKSAVILFITMTIGGWIGAKFALKGSDKLVKISAFSFAFLVGLKMLWESWF